MLLGLSSQKWELYRIFWATCVSKWLFGLTIVFMPISWVSSIRSDMSDEWERHKHIFHFNVGEELLSGSIAISPFNEIGLECLFIHAVHGWDYPKVLQWGYCPLSCSGKDNLWTNLFCSQTLPVQVSIWFKYTRDCFRYMWRQLVGTCWLELCKDFLLTRDLAYECTNSQRS